ncbi:tRNA (adenosine(37)-N6)-dimethylallyltransferase MiaA [Salegentibacter mishustinae]|uniref:tRNA dimethylallyltransferase n=1 Tax=Salegentibacter mishustinae TaxID=270918 RepID=A0A0Q9ZAN5_9FLAO|nr:tRNA (adenosine(37)-N6)-dimethylallyltransferase MiaA [Salegentibacter mishustinae]KRG30076.1 tRNA dimethylallyltransferase [Salegentibacter mishustinae]PNW19542.1 tRNA dimethylallyltransferase [Salegentibacter mishustinae]PZX62001.1 tRNA dimethylallyltransferase [Salegentibacter mishustinae]GGW95245.1 tRNA dimethylallyltransferase [Salegentibacter mishustinae]
MTTNYLINIVGPTAIGKTSLAIQLANKFDTEIISADSRQFYKEMSIGTAVPSTEELNAAKHHFIQHISIEDNYNVGDFESDAIKKLDELFKNNKIVIMVGGSGLYTKSVLEGLDYFPEVSLEIRQEHNLKLEKEGLDSLQQQLHKLDPDYYKIVDLENPHRVIRALEVCMSSGKPYSSYLNQPKKKRNFTAISIGLSAEREIIYDRINRRVDLMITEGLMDEAKALFTQRELNALNTVGYKELFSYLEGKDSLETAVSEIKKNTRRFAKRQLTWFRKDQEINWFDYKTPVEEIQQFLNSKIKNYEN